MSGRHGIRSSPFCCSNHGSVCNHHIILQVARLYRNSLKTLLSWAVDRDIFNEKATELRARFDSSRGVSPSAAARLLRVRNLFVFLYGCGCCMIARVLFLLYSCNSCFFHFALLTGVVLRYSVFPHVISIWLALFSFLLFSQEGEDELFSWTHPDMYVVPYMPGGSKFMRNPPPPMSVCFPDGNLPADAPRYAVNPDMSIAKPETGKNAVGTVLVDFYKKSRLRRHA